jgi:hypothetical protein
MENVMNTELNDLLIEDMVMENENNEKKAADEKYQLWVESEEDKYKACTVVSASKKYLWLGIMFAAFAVILEIMAWVVVKEIGVSLILQIPVSICLLFTSTVVDWFNRDEFTMYFARFSDDVSLSYIKENYAIVEIDAHAVLFVDPKDELLYNSWKLYNGDSLYKLEVDYFM